MFRKFSIAAVGVVVFCVAGAASAALVVNDGTTTTLTFDAAHTNVFAPGKGTNSGGSATGVAEPDQFNFFGVFNANASGGLMSTATSISHQFHNGGTASPFGADSNGDADFGDAANTTNQLGAERAADLVGATSNGLLVSKEGDFANSGIYLRIQNNTGATVSDWNFSAKVYYEESGGGASTATFGYAVDNGTDPTFSTGMTYTDFGAAPAAISTDSYATLAYTLNETVTTSGVADGDYIVLGFFDQLNNANGSGIVIDDIGITAVISAVPEPSSFFLLGAISLLAFGKHRTRS